MKTGSLSCNQMDWLLRSKCDMHFICLRMQIVIPLEELVDYVPTVNLLEPKGLQNATHNHDENHC
jgi:hypothetical protein